MFIYSNSNNWTLSSKWRLARSLSLFHSENNKRWMNTEYLFGITVICINLILFLEDMFSNKIHNLTGCKLRILSALQIFIFALGDKNISI